MPGVDDLAQSLNAIAARLRELGDEGLVRELTRAIGDAVAPLPDRIREGLPSHLPNLYAGVLDADLRISRSTSTTGEEARVTVLASVTGTKKRKLALSDAGSLFHPVFGDRLDWKEQRVAPGWFTRPAEDAAPDVREAIEAALDDVAGKAAGKGL